MPVEMDVVVLAGQQHRAVQGRYGGDTSKHDGGGERPFGVVPWIVAGSGVVIAGVGIGLLVNGLGDISDAEDKCPNRVCADQASVDLGQGGIAKSTAGKVLIPIGAVALAGGLVWQFVFNGKRATAVKVQANTSFVGLSVSGHY